MMTEQEIINGNLIITKFIGYFDKAESFSKRRGIDFNPSEDIAEIASLKYHSDASQLVPVAQKLLLKLRELDTDYIFRNKRDLWHDVMNNIAKLTRWDFEMNTLYKNVLSGIELLNKNAL